ncbi:MAG: type VI secretion system tip protein VgrG [Thermomicrobiales bacterium]|jgi:type VI secretion system secreted protein VgrG|nr:MAG: type VI secretion system tip protein VgrG [Thermomicrobiales bacterium]
MARVMDIVTPLGPGVLLFRSMRARESLGRLFEYSVTALSTRNDIDPNALLGKNVTIKLELPGGGTRCFDGIVARFSLAGSQGRLVRYEMVLRPWLWFLTRTAHCRIFQGKTVKDIISEVCDPGEYPDVAIEFNLIEPYRTWEYCVQYRETDFNFVSRLMEQEGMYYFFRHVEGRHTMVVVDAPSAHTPRAKYENIPFVLDNRSATTDRERIADWYFSKEVQPGSYVIDDYDFKKPYDDLKRQRMEVRDHEHALHEFFDYPGEYEKTDEGEHYVKVRLEEVQAQHERIHATTNARGLSVGDLFTLQLHPRQDQNRQYLVVGTSINLSSSEHEAAGTGGATFACSFECMPAITPYRAPRETPKPVVQGVQTARVVGPSDKEIWTDQYGRVKVHFHWDRFGPQNENSTCWIRVAQGWAGKGYGIMNVPRIGHEVVVDFIEGDPDQPLITGRVYNEDQKVPYELPKYDAYMTWRTRSTPGGGVRDFNELRFDDRKDKEQVFIHAQRRMDIRVKRNKYETVLGGSNTSIGGGHVLTIGGNLDLHTKGSTFQRTEGKLDSSVGGTTGLVHEGATTVVVNGKLSLSAPEIVVEAKTKISLKVGGNCVIIDMSGVTIAGTMIKINSGGYGGDASDADIEDPLDAGQADTGEPGYLDNLPKGGGRGGRKKRHAGAHHGHTTPRPGEPASVTAMRQRLAQTPSGRHALEVYDRYGVQPTFLPGQGSSYAGSKFGTNNMNLDPNNPGDWNEHTFVHEMNHAQADHEGNTVFGQEKSTPRPGYVNSMVNEEADGMALQAQYANEQAQNGTPMANPPQWQGAYNTAYQNGRANAAAANPNATEAELDAAGKQAGQQAMVNQLNTGAVAPSTSTGQTYPQYYGGIWDSDNAPAP